MRAKDPRGDIARHSPRTRRKCGNIFGAICGRNVGWVPLRGTTRHSLPPLSDLRSRTFVPWHGVYDWKSCGAKDHAGIEPSGHPARFMLEELFTLEFVSERLKIAPITLRR